MGKSSVIGKIKYSNPSDVFRKRLRKREIKRNREQREIKRNKMILQKDEFTLRSELKKIENLKKNKGIDGRVEAQRKRISDAINRIETDRKKREKLQNSMKVKGLQKIIKNRFEENKQNVIGFKKTQKFDEIDDKNELVNINFNLTENGFNSTEKRDKEQNYIEEKKIKIMQIFKINKKKLEILESLDNDQQPFFPPGILNFSENAINGPPGTILTLEKNNLNLKPNDLSKLNSNSMLNRHENNANVIIQTNDIFDNKNKSLSVSRRDFEKNLVEKEILNSNLREKEVDPLDPMKKSFNSFNVKNKNNKIKPISNFRDKIGPKFDKTNKNVSQTDSLHRKTVYQKEEALKDLKNISSSLTELVPARVSVKRKPKKKNKTIKDKVLLAPNVECKEDNNDYEAFVKEIENIL